MSLPPILVELKANAGEFMAKMGEARKEVSKLGTEGAAHAQKFATVGKAALLGFAGAAVSVGGIAVHAALEGEAAHAALAQAVKNAGGSMEQVEPHVKSLEGRFAHLGYTNDELESGLTVLTTSLRSPTKAMDDIGLAADLARYKHISLADASLVVAKATEGQLKPLKQLGIDLPVAAGGAAKLQSASTRLRDAQERLRLAEDKAAHTTGPAHVKALEAVRYAQLNVTTAQSKMNAVQGAARQITTALASAVGGQAAAAANTYSGKLQAARASAQNMMEQLGNALLPTIARLVSYVAQVVSWFNQHKAAAIALGSVIGGVLTAAIAAYIASLVRASAAQVKALGEDIAKGAIWVASKVFGYQTAATAAEVASAEEVAASTAAGVAMTASTGGILLAIAALVAGAVFLATHWKQVWNWIKEAAQAAWGFLKAVFNEIINSGFSPIKYDIMIVKLYFETAWAAIKLAVAVAGAVIRGVITGISAALDGIKAALGWLKKVWDTVWSGIHTAISDAWNFIRPIIDAIVSALNTLKNVAGDVMGVLGKIASAPGKVLHALHIPGLASGGYVTGPTLAMVGEGREPEYVLPESKLQGAVDAAAGAGGGSGEIHLHLYIDGQEVHTSVRKADREFRLRNGRSAFA